MNDEKTLYLEDENDKNQNNKRMNKNLESNDLKKINSVINSVALDQDLLKDEFKKKNEGLTEFKNTTKRNFESVMDSIKSTKELIVKQNYIMDKFQIQIKRLIYISGILIGLAIIVFLVGLSSLTREPEYLTKNQPVVTVLVTPENTIKPNSEAEQNNKEENNGSETENILLNSKDMYFDFVKNYKNVELEAINNDKRDDIKKYIDESTELYKTINEDISKLQEKNAKITLTNITFEYLTIKSDGTIVVHVIENVEYLDDESKDNEPKKTENKVQYSILNKGDKFFITKQLYI